MWSGGIFVATAAIERRGQWRDECLCRELRRTVALMLGSEDSDCRVSWLDIPLLAFDYRYRVAAVVVWIVKVETTDCVFHIKQVLKTEWISSGLPTSMT